MSQKSFHSYMHNIFSTSRSIAQYVSTGAEIAIHSFRCLKWHLAMTTVRRQFLLFNCCVTESTINY